MVAIVGPTACGKTPLGEAVAARIGGEVVCADSRQVFAELELGTGKPGPDERAAAPHHLFDVLHLGESASAGWYGDACARVRADIHARGRIPVLVGGSGLYLRAAQDGLGAEPPRDEALRARLRSELAESGSAVLHARLAVLDPAAASRLHPNDGQRVTRALEVVESSGRPLAWWQAQAPPPPDEAWHVFQVDLGAHTLNRNIRERSEWMFEAGLVEEVRALLDGPRAGALRALHAIGYDEAIGVIEDRLTVAQARKLTSLHTRQLAKRQRTWFRHQVAGTTLDANGAGVGELVEAVMASLGSRQER